MNKIISFLKKVFGLNKEKPKQEIKLIDANDMLANLCDAITSTHIKLYNQINECFPQRKMTHEQRAHIENLIKDLDIILKEDDLIPESNVVNLNTFMRGH